MAVKRNYIILITFILLLISLVTMFSATQIAYAETIIDNNANLISLEVEGFQLPDAFDKNKTDYVLSVASTVDRVNIIVQTENAGATFEIKGNRKLSIGKNNFEIVVLATDKVTTKTYKLTVYKSDGGILADDCTLKNIVVEGYDLDPKFDPEVDIYDVKVPYGIETVKITYEINDEKATAETTFPEKLEIGENLFVIKVKAPSGATKEYTINVERSADRPLSTNNLLAKVVLLKDNQDVEPTFEVPFDSKKNEYKILTQVKTKSFNIDIIPGDNYQTIVVESEKNISYDDELNLIIVKDLKMGETLIKVNVTSEAGEVNIYKFTISRPEGNDNNYLKDLSVEGYNINPQFSRDVFDYKVRLDTRDRNVRIIPKTEVVDATYRIHGGLNLQAEKDNVVVIEVLAPNLDYRLYTITFVYSKETDKIIHDTNDGGINIDEDSSMPGGKILGIPKWLLGVAIVGGILVLSILGTLFGLIIPRKYKVKHIKGEIQPKDKKKDKKVKESSKEEKIETPPEPQIDDDKKEE